MTADTRSIARRAPLPEADACAWCRGRIRAGEPVFPVRGGRLVHETCPQPAGDHDGPGG